MYILLITSAVFFALSLFLFMNGKSPNKSDALPKYSSQLSKSEIKKFLIKLFIISWVIRFFMVLLLNASDAIVKLGLSSDSLRYDRIGRMIANQMFNGNFNWPNWIDDGWFQFTGLIYYLFGAHSIYIQLFNITVAGIVPILVYLTVDKIFSNSSVSKLTTLMVAFFPSFIYWSLLMLKDPISWLAVALLVYGTVSIKIKFSVKYMLSILLGLTIFLGVREYMMYISIMIIILSLVPLKGSGMIVFARWVAVVTIIGFVAQLAGFGFLAMDRIADSVYFDLDYLNQTRVKLSDHGSGRFFQNEADAVWGQGLWKDLKSFSLAVYYSFLSLDITSLGSVRQLMALPEVLLFMNLFPNLVVGAREVWRNHRNLALPLLGFGFGILVVYGSTTTNKGALFRWRMQALPYLLAIISYGIYYRKKGWFYKLLVKYKI